MIDAPDATLLRRWGNGDGDAGNALVRRHFDRIYGFFRSKLAGEIDDLIQRTFLAAMRSHERLREASSFRAYLFAIARNELYAELRAKLRDHVTDLGASSIDQLAADHAHLDPVLEIAEHAEHVLLLRGLRRLPLDDQIALELFYWKGLSTEEVGGILGQTGSGVRSRLARARGRLATMLQTLSADARLVESTIDGFEGWSASLGQQLDPGR